MKGVKPRPVVLLHGWTMSGASFDRLIARLGPDFACRAPDLPGHGAERAQPATLDACAERAAREIAAAGPGAILLGWSMGAAAVWRLLERRGPGDLAGLVTIDMGPKLGPDWPLGLRDQTPERLRRGLAEMREDWPAAGQKIARVTFAGREGGPDMSREEAVRQVFANDPRLILPYWEEMLAMDMRDLVPRISLPWLVAYGAQSRLYAPETSEWLVRTAPDAHPARFEHSGHAPHLEEPEAFVKAFRDFAARL